MISCEDCTGDFLENSKSCHNCFFCTDGEDVTSGIMLADAKDTFLCSFFGHHSELGYHCQSTIDANRCSFCYFAADSTEAEYGDTVLNCKNVFGCVNLRQKQYCILNKQYTKEEYEKFRLQLIEHMKRYGEWGEFLPKDLGCYAYNESTAHEFFPLTKEEAVAKGFRWREEEHEQSSAERVIPAAQLPDNISDIPDDVLNWAIQSERSGRAFRIIKQELDFYRQHNIPLPHLHPDERFADRFATYANKPVLYARSCMKCSKPIQTTYAPDRPEIVYCEECYLAAVY
jgi:hypothetical protein